jgi:beta-glucanase (GH16 family)
MWFILFSCAHYFFGHRNSLPTVLDTNNPLHYYSHDSIRTSNGVLNLTTDIKPKEFKTFNEETQRFDIISKEVRSGMLQSWNKFCFTGGIIEFSAKLPGNPRTGGLWPASKS